LTYTPMGTAATPPHRQQPLATRRTDAQR